MQRDQLGGLVTRPEFCAQLGINARTARRWAAAKYGPEPLRLGKGHGRTYYVQTEIDAFMAEVKARPSVVA